MRSTNHTSSRNDTASGALRDFSHEAADDNAASNHCAVFLQTSGNLCTLQGVKPAKLAAILVAHSPSCGFAVPDVIEPAQRAT
jgi:uncharacterized protein YbbK (DUF523 family)